jgi:TonB-dependent receptor
MAYTSIVASDAIGTLPDENAAEALNRIAGISIERDQGEGRFVVVRGIDPELNNFQVNGVSVAAPENESRAIALDVIPSELISSIEVSKVPTPEMDGDAIGGSIDIKIASPFDSNSRILRGKSSALYNDLRGGLGFKSSLTYGDLFMDDKLGFIVGLSYGEKKVASDNNEIDGPWVEEDGYYTPEEVEFREYNVTRYRRGVSTGIEFKPNDDSYFYLKGLYSYFADQEARYRTELKVEDQSIESLDANGGVYGPDEDDGEFISETGRDMKDRFEEQTIYQLVAGAEQTFGNTQVDYSLSYTFAEEAEPDRLDTAFVSEQPVTYALDWSNPKNVRIARADAALFEPSNYEFDEIVRENNITDEEEWAAKIDVRNDFELGGTFGYTQLGMKYASKLKTADLEVEENDDSSDAMESLADVLRNSLGRNTFGQGPLADAGAIRDVFYSNEAAFAMERNDEDSEGGDYESEEDVLAVYAMSSISIDKLTILAGVRVENTQFSTTGNEITLDEEGDIESILSITADKDYTDFFPHLHLRYDINEGTVARLAVTKTIARPKFSHSAFRRLTNREDEEIEVGNPNLDPYEAWNFDASVEFYSPNLGLFSAAFFYKDISNYIFDINSEIEDEATGYDVITWLNGDSAQIYGLEFNFNRELTFLPEAMSGFGIAANLTLTDSEATTDIRAGENLRFLKQADTIGTIALYYNNYGLNVRVAGTYRGEYIDEFGGDASEDRWVGEHFQVDLTASYQVNDQFSVFAEVINLNNEPLYAYFGESNGLSQYEEYSWSASLGIKFNL